MGTPKPILERVLIGGGNNSEKACLRMTFERPLHNSDFPRDRHGHRKFDNSMIKERTAALEAVRHAGQVDLDQQIAGEIGHQVRNHRARDRFATRRQCKGRREDRRRVGLGRVVKRRAPRVARQSSCSSE